MRISQKESSKVSFLVIPNNLGIRKIRVFGRANALRDDIVSKVIECLIEGLGSVFGVDAVVKHT